MPIYEHKCKSCERIFERLEFKKDQAVVICPSCGGNNTQRVMSCFSFGSSSSFGFEEVPTSSSCKGPGGFS